MVFKRWSNVHGAIDLHLSGFYFVVAVKRVPVFKNDVLGRTGIRLYGFLPFIEGSGWSKLGQQKRDCRMLRDARTNR